MNIDQEITATEKLVFDLRRRHNALVAAVGAPTEILCLIFSLYPVKLKFLCNIARPPDWLALLQVCSRWRRIYISTPSLWSSPGWVWLPDLGRYIEIVLERAVGAPIDIEFCFNDIKHVDRLPATLPSAIPRLRTLKFSGQDYKLSKMLRTLNHTPAPLLETLEFELTSDEYDKGHDLRRCPDIFAGQAPVLKALTLRNCIFAWDWSFLALPTLAQLNIEGHSRGPRATLAEILDILSRLPLLEHLRLTNCLPLIMGQVEHNDRNPVDLPNLRRFKLISDSPLALHAVAVHIRVPTSAKYTIRCSNYSFGDQPVLVPLHSQLLTNIVINHAFVDDLDGLPREGIERLFGQHLCIRGSDEDASSHESVMEFETMSYKEHDDLDSPFEFVRTGQKWDVSFELSMTWKAGFEPNTPSRLRANMTCLAFGGILNAVPLRGLSAAFLAGDIFQYRALFALTFQRALNVEALTLAGETQYRALEAMSGLLDPDETLDGQPVFPSLKRLCVCATPAQTVLSDGRSASAHLRAMLRLRRDASQDTVGGPRMLDRLGPFSSEIPDGEVRQLERLVRHGSVDVIRPADIERV